MTTAHHDVDDQVAALRHAFDAGFADVPQRGRQDLEDVLAIRAGTNSLALRLRDIAGLFADKRCTRLPGSPPAHLGVAGYRGTLVPVFDLCALLGHAGDGPARWSVLATGDAPVAFAFHHVDGLARIKRGAVMFGGAASLANPAPRTVVDVASVLGLIKTRAGTDNRQERERS